MSTHKNIDLVCVAVIIAAILITVLFMNGEALGIQLVVDEDSEQHSNSGYFTTNDLNGDWDTSGATELILQGDSVRISGSGAYAYDGGVVISSAGSYVISGTLTDGSITVDAEKNSKVALLLNGVDIYCSDDACIRVDTADKVFITLASGSVNTLESGSQYSKTALDDGTDAVIFGHDDITINGSGSLTVTANYSHGIAGNDDLVITGGTISVTAPADGIRANDSLRICNADITVNAGDDGIVVSKEESYLYIESGTFSITSGDDAVHTAGDITIAGGSFIINAGDDAIHSDTAISISSGSILIQSCYEGIEAVNIDISGGDIEIYPEDDGINANGGESGFGGMFDKILSPGFDSGEDTDDTVPQVSISGGSILIINSTATDADGIDSNGSIYISGGDILISLPASGSNSALDYGSENQGVCEISGGRLIACGSYSMAESMDSTSTQASVMYIVSGGVSAGTELTLTDAEGSTLMDWTVPNSFSCAIISCPEIALGETYTLIIGDSYDEITVSEVSASYGDAQSSMFGGTMNMGGLMNHGGRGDGHGGGGHGGGDGQPGGTQPGGTQPGDSSSPPPQT